MNFIHKQLVQILLAVCVSLSVNIAYGDEVTHWNAVLEKTAAGTPHFFQSRSAAIVHLAVFEAVNAIQGDYEPYLGTISAPSWAVA